jgi:hypothetical protein
MLRDRGIRKALLAGFIVLGLSSTSFAQSSSQSSGLGQAWPNAVDMSASPNWHVYVFWRDGVKYVQINDLGGNVLAAIGTAHGTTIVLPVGVDAENVSTVAKKATEAAQVVYHDAATTVTATPRSNGATTFVVQSQDQSCPAYGCSGPGFAN